MALLQATDAKGWRRMMKRRARNEKRARKMENAIRRSPFQAA